MENIYLEWDGKSKGQFIIKVEDEPLGKMEVLIAETRITVLHTEVLPKAEGKGLAKKLLEFMVNYARKNNLKVIPFCPFVLAQFKRNESLYADVWAKNG